MAHHYKGFKLFLLPREGGYFVRMRVTGWPICQREAPFTETDIFATESDALSEARRLADGDDRQMLFSNTLNRAGA